MDAKSRPQHRRNQSSKSGILKSLVSPKAKPASPEHTRENARSEVRTQTVPILPADHPHASARGGGLRERAGNVQSPPSSPAKKKGTLGKSDKDAKPCKSKDVKDPKKSKSSSNLAAVFAKMNRSSKDLTAQVPKDNKENNAPPASSNPPLETPIWAQYSQKHSNSSRPDSRGSKSSHNLRDEIAKYTPEVYSPSKQRNFNGTIDEPGMRPTLARNRPQSAYYAPSDSFITTLGRKVSGKSSMDNKRRSEDTTKRDMPVSNGRVSMEKSRIMQRTSIDRKASGSSTEQAPPKEKLNVTKRGRVMAAVAAFQGKNKDGNTEQVKKEDALDEKAVDAQFEAVLESRNIPEPMRQKMRTLTLRVKADFIKQDKGTTPPGTLTNGNLEKSKSSTKITEMPPEKKEEDESKSTKRSRARSRTFTFSKAKNNSKSESPSKKQRSQSKSRPISVEIPKEAYTGSQQQTPTTPIIGSFGRKSAAPAVPAEYIKYLQKNQDPTKVEVGRLHKLRILLRNETVTWVDGFISQGGMSEIVGLLNRTMEIEWREDHEDQVLHEGLLCLKGLCTTERALAELNKVADQLFPALIAMLFDEEKKGPAEYTTRTIIINVLFNFLAAADSSSGELETRARRILRYLGEPSKPEDDRPVDFVLGMRVPRPYKLWSREVSNVTKEVFWIFLHHLNVVPLPKPSSSHSNIAAQDEEERAKTLAATYTHRHFPGSRPPVPAAPYIGGVEWDATTYLTAHLDLLNGVIASLPSATARNTLRSELQASGFEKVMGNVLRTCKEKFYSGVHDGLRAWVAAAAEDGWETRFVREGPSEEEVKEQAMKSSPKKSPKKKKDVAPQIGEAPKLDLGLKLENSKSKGNEEDDGWLG